jgi:hypothetical protein
VALAAKLHDFAHGENLSVSQVEPGAIARFVAALAAQGSMGEFDLRVEVARNLVLPRERSVIARLVAGRARNTDRCAGHVAKPGVEGSERRRVADLDGMKWLGFRVCAGEVSG